VFDVDALEPVDVAGRGNPTNRPHMSGKRTPRNIAARLRGAMMAYQTNFRGGDISVEDDAQREERRLERLIDRLPYTMQKVTRWLRRPSSWWTRLPAGVLLIGGGLIGFLPLFGFWMLPLGLMLLAEDLLPLRWARRRALDWTARRWPHWFAESAT
jgi:hypothetical protein